MNKITLCLIAANRPKFLREMLDSIRHQSCMNFELIISDDSKEGLSKEEIDALPNGARYIWNQIPLGEAANSNQVIRMANTEYVALIHDDDKLHHQYIEKTFSYLDQNNVDVLMVNQWYINEESRIIYGRNLDPNSRFIKLDPRTILLKLLSLQKVHPIYTPGLIFRRSLLNKIEFSEQIGTHIDTNFLLKMLLHVKSFDILNYYLYFSRVSPNSGRGNSSRKGNSFLEQINIYVDFYKYLDSKGVLVEGCSLDKTKNDYIQNVVLTLNNPFFWTSFHNKDFPTKFKKLIEIYKSVIAIKSRYALSLRLNLFFLAGAIMPINYIEKRYSYFISKIR